MEAISPLPCWLLRIGGHFILPVLIRMSAGSVTCNLSTKPQQLHRDGEHSHNDIILDWGRVSGGDRWCRFSSPGPPPLFLQTFWNKTCATFTWLLYIMGPSAEVKELFPFLEFIYPKTIFWLTTVVLPLLKGICQKCLSAKQINI